MLEGAVEGGRVWFLEIGKGSVWGNEGWRVFFARMEERRWSTCWMSSDQRRFGALEVEADGGAEKILLAPLGGVDELART